MDGLGFGLAGPQCLPVDSSAMRLLQSTYPLRLSGCISPLYPVGLGWRMGRHDRDQSLSYLLAELESSNPQRIFPASGFLGKTYALRLSGCISPIPCGLGWRMGRHDRDRVAIRRGNGTQNALGQFALCRLTLALDWTVNAMSGDVPEGSLETTWQGQAVV